MWMSCHELRKNINLNLSLMLPMHLVAHTKIPGIRMIKYDEAEKNNYQYVILEIDEDITGLPRDLIVDILHAENILARRYFYPGCHEMEPYRSLNPQAGSVLPETERLTRRVLSLPSGTA